MRRSSQGLLIALIVLIVLISIVLTGIVLYVNYAPEHAPYLQPETAWRCEEPALYFEVDGARGCTGTLTVGEETYPVELHFQTTLVYMYVQTGVDQEELVTAPFYSTEDTFVMYRLSDNPFIEQNRVKCEKVTGGTE